MRSNLITVSDPTTGAVGLVHVDEIRTVTEYESGSKILTHMGVMIADESPREIMEQYTGAIVPEFFADAEPCEACRTTVVDSNPTNTTIRLPDGPTIKDLEQKLSVRAINIVETAYVEGFSFKPIEDWSTVPLSAIAGISAETWALKKNSTDEVGAQICHWIGELMKGHNTDQVTD